jgi:hypothetical protein
MKYFTGLLSFIFLLVVGSITIISIAPHNDAKMRGFTPCTYEMGVKLSDPRMNVGLMYAFRVVMQSYVCYGEVIKDGVQLWLNGEIEKPWDNYLFEPEIWEVPSELEEPFSDDLLRANKLDSDGEVFQF